MYSGTPCENLTVLWVRGTEDCIPISSVLCFNIADENIFFCTFDSMGVVVTGGRKHYGAKEDDLYSRTNEVTGTYAKACVEVAIEAHVPVIDLWSSMQEKDGWETTYLR